MLIWFWLSILFIFSFSVSLWFGVFYFSSLFRIMFLFSVSSLVACSLLLSAFLTTSSVFGIIFWLLFYHYCFFFNFVSCLCCSYSSSFLLCSWILKSHSCVSSPVFLSSWVMFPSTWVSPLPSLSPFYFVIFFMLTAIVAFYLSTWIYLS